MSMSPSTALVRSKAPSPWGYFLRGFFRNPVMVGSIMPSTKRTINRVLKPVDWAKTRMFVEYGPGVGTFCRTVLSRLPADARYIAIDTNAAFISYLRDTIEDSRFSAIHGSATDVEAIVRAHGSAQADHIISGLPFSTLPPGVADRILTASRRVLRPGGIFTVYLYNPKVGDMIAPYFPRIEHDMEWFNLPPTQIWWAHKD